MSTRPPSHDPTDYYPGDLSSLPLANRDSVPMPSTWTQFITSAHGADNDDRDDARRDEALNTARAALVAELERRGVHDDRYSWQILPGSQPVYNDDRIWQGIARARSLDKTAFHGIPDKPDDWSRAITAPIDAEQGARQTIEQRSGWLSWLSGKFAGGISDPLNGAAMVLGPGEAKTVSEAVLRSAVLNAKIEAAQQPEMAIERASRGRSTSSVEAAGNVAMAAGIGAVAGGVLKVGEQPARALAEQVRKVVGWGRMTDAERAAVNVVERDHEIASASPFTPGAGTEAHMDRADAAYATLTAPEPVSVPTAPEPVGPDARANFMARVRSAESSGSDAARNPESSATGRYQFTDKTWLRYYKREIGANGQTDSQILGHRADGVIQDRLMSALTDDNAAALRRIGAREDAGNLYLEHFAGQGGAEKILKAAPDTPIEQLLAADAIAANKFLRGKTASDVIDWAHARMGERPRSGPLLRRGLFDNDEEFAAAQRAVDAEDEALTRAQGEQRGLRAAYDEADPPLMGENSPAGQVQQTAAPVVSEAEAPAGMDWEPSSRQGGAAPQNDTIEATAPPSEPEIEQFQTAKGSTYRVEADGTTSRDKAFRPEHGVAEQGRQPTSEATHYVTAEDALKLAEFQAQGGPKVAIQRTSDGRIGVRYLEGKDAGKFEKRTVVRPESGPAVGLTPIETWNKGERVHFGNPITAVTRAVPEHVAAAARAADDLTQMAARGGPSREALAGFDEPGTGIGPRTAIQSLEHDIRMDAIENPNRTVRLSEEAGEQRIADVIKDIDDDQSALAAARLCMVPTATGGA